MAQTYDVIIIGAGIVGSMVARFLSKYKLDILLIDKDSDHRDGNQFRELRGRSCRL